MASCFQHINECLYVVKSQLRSHWAKKVDALVGMAYVRKGCWRPFNGFLAALITNITLSFLTGRSSRGRLRKRKIKHVKQVAAVVAA